MARRNGLSLIEVIVVVAIVAILLGLLLPAVQRVRDAALWTRSANNVRQIQLSVHQFAGANNDRVPVLNGEPNGPNPHRSLLGAILPLIEQGAVYDAIYNTSTPAASLLVRQYVGPADPTNNAERGSWGYTSYAANAFAFQPRFTLAAGYPDGLSNTLAFAEHYSHCGGAHFLWPIYRVDIFSMHRASFSDGGLVFDDQNYGEVYPVTKGTPPVSGPAFLPVGPRRDDTPPDAVLQPIRTPFQTAPAVLDCHGMIPQTPHREGMLAGLMDGSVRRLSPSTSMATFWGAVTPAGGEVLTDW